MSCTIVGAVVVSCLVNPATRPSAAEAARILEPYQFVYVEPAPPMGPSVLIIGSSPTDGPFGPFPALPPARRLDGSFLSTPPWGVHAYIGRSFHPTDHMVRPSAGPREPREAPTTVRRTFRPNLLLLQLVRKESKHLGAAGPLLAAPAGNFLQGRSSQ